MLELDSKGKSLDDSTVMDGVVQDIVRESRRKSQHLFFRGARGVYAIENPSVRRSEAESECRMTTRIAHLEGIYRVRSTCERSTAYAPLKAARVARWARWWAVVL